MIPDTLQQVARPERGSGGASPEISLRWLVAVLVVASLLFGLAIAEGGLRLLAWRGNPVASELARRDPFAVKVEPEGRYGYRQRPGAVLEYARGRSATANTEGFRGPIVERPKAATTFRVLLLGESTTHGYGVNDNETIDAYMRSQLSALGSNKRIEVVNLAYDGYDAYQVWQRLLSDGIALQPDVIVMNVGVNDVRNARFSPPLGDPDPRTLLWGTELRRLTQESVGGPTLWTRLKHVFFLARLPGYTHDLFTQRRASSAPAVAYPDAADNFEKNVLRVADVARRLRVPLFLSTPPSVIMSPEAPPEMAPKSYWLGTRAATQAYRDTLSARLQSVASRLASGQAVSYVRHRLSPDLFFDDCHLLPEGNRKMALDFASAIAPLVVSH